MVVAVRLAAAVSTYQADVVSRFKAQPPFGDW